MLGGRVRPVAAGTGLVIPRGMTSTVGPWVTVDDQGRFEIVDLPRDARALQGRGSGSARVCHYEQVRSSSWSTDGFDRT